LFKVAQQEEGIRGGYDVELIPKLNKKFDKHEETTIKTKNKN
jgi:hypothetical protein